jgi:CheY-like chemotaxis protein/DNA-directed RNA polymerase specialized sigma24 family protein
MYGVLNSGTHSLIFHPDIICAQSGSLENFMSLGQTIAPHLPYLRRYGRAVSGSQHIGDELVSRMLHSLIEDSSQIDTNRNIQVEIFRILQLQIADLAESVSESGSNDATPMGIADARLRRIPSLARQVLLLTALEGFSEQDAAHIVGLDIQGVRDLIDEAMAEIDRQTRANILIIEDEPIIAMDIEMIVRDLGHDVVAVATTHKEAVAEAKKHRPSLVLADIQLADNSSGIEAVQEILSEMDLPVIFITAFPERLLTGDRPEPAFLLTKPFQPATLRATIGQVLFFNEATVPA